MSQERSKDELWRAIDVKVGTTGTPFRQEEQMLEIANPEGKRLILPYSRIAHLLFTPEDLTTKPLTKEAIEFCSDTYKVTAEGGALQKLYEDLVSRRVRRIETTMEPSAEGMRPHISSVRWEEL